MWRQVKSGAAKVYVYNSPNSTPDITLQVAEARAAGVPVVAATEALSPMSDTFEHWQATQLQGLPNALAQATER